MNLLLPLALTLCAALGSCGQQSCDALPVCLDPGVYNRNHEVQPNAAVAPDLGPLTLHPGETRTVTVVLDRRGLPDSLPVTFTGTFVVQGIENPNGSHPYFQRASGTTLFDSEGLTVELSTNPVVGNSLALTLRAAVGTPAREEGLTFYLQREGTRYGSSGALSLGIEIQAP